MPILYEGISLEDNPQNKKNKNEDKDDRHRILLYKANRWGRRDSNPQTSRVLGFESSAYFHFRHAPISACE